MANSHPISGIYEVCIGCQDSTTQIEYWQQFGYRLGETGELSATKANNLYGVTSAVKSVRLYHQDSDHGLLRLMQWEKPTNEGLQMLSMKMTGTRWGTAVTNDILNILNHVDEAKKAGFPVKYIYPQWDVIYNRDRKIRPFVDTAIGVREMMLMQPLTRQIFFQRFNYTLPYYGTINEGCTFKTSQFTHAGIVVQDDSRETLRFYEETLGLLRVRDDDETTYESSETARQIFELQPKERFSVTTFDDPRSSKTDLQAVRSGRIYLIRFPETIKLESCFEKSQPGCLGMSLYTLRVRDIEDYFHRIQTSNAQKFSEIETNEFGERSFSFVSPDGYFWTLLDGYNLED